MTMEALSRQSEDWYSLLEVQGCYSNVWYALNLAESLHGSPPAREKDENGQLCYGCYSLYLRLGIAWMDVSEGVWGGLDENARWNVVGQVKMQKVPYFATKLCFDG